MLLIHLTHTYILIRTQGQLIHELEEKRMALQEKSSCDTAQRIQRLMGMRGRPRGSVNQAPTYQSVYRTLLDQFFAPARPRPLDFPVIGESTAASSFPLIFCFLIYLLLIFPLLHLPCIFSLDTCVYFFYSPFLFPFAFSASLHPFFFREEWFFTYFSSSSSTFFFSFCSSSL